MIDAAIAFHKQRHLIADMPLSEALEHGRESYDIVAVFEETCSALAPCCSLASDQAGGIERGVPSRRTPPATFRSGVHPSHLRAVSLLVLLLSTLLSIAASLLIWGLCTQLRIIWSTR